jgi:hypothetical protein
MMPTRYSGTVHEDALIAGWWSALVTSGDWDKCFLIPQRGLGYLYAYLQREVTFYYVEQDNVLVLAAWAEPCLLKGAFFSLWIHPRWRGQGRALDAVGSLMTLLFTQVDTLLSVTDQAPLLDGYQKMGYTLVGPLPHLGHAGRPLWLLALTREGLQGGCYDRWNVRRERHRRLRRERSFDAGSERRITDGAPAAPTGDQRRPHSNADWQCADDPSSPCSTCA